MANWTRFTTANSIESCLELKLHPKLVGLDFNTPSFVQPFVFSLAETLQYADRGNNGIHKFQLETHRWRLTEIAYRLQNVNFPHQQNG